MRTVTNIGALRFYQVGVYVHGHVLSIEQARGSLQRRCCRQLQPATRELLGVALRDSSVWEEDRFRKVLEVEGMFRVGRRSALRLVSR